uniref:tRNA (guanine(37)-N1)-methyltransferase n=1 Tax=Eptatretus burgeri TaxID=7764 RepID=A0A8C4N8E0_EPTBU
MASKAATQDVTMTTTMTTTTTTTTTDSFQEGSSKDPKDNLGPSSAVRGMTQLNRGLFASTVCVPALRVPTKSAYELSRRLRKVRLNKRDLKCVIDAPREEEGEGGELGTTGEGRSALVEGTCRAAIKVKKKDQGEEEEVVAKIHGDGFETEVKCFEGKMEESGSSSINEHKLILLDPKQVTVTDGLQAGKLGHILAQTRDADLRLVSHRVDLDYVNFHVDEVLRAVLPEGQDVPSGFSRMGHIAHMNLREHQLDYKYLIGQVIIDKNHGIRTVVNKTHTINNTFRNFSMEVIAGEDDTVTTVKENGISFEFDFAAVYWNTRLCTERQRLLSRFCFGDTIYDIFAGIGPFSIPAARAGCRVLANDLNPEAYRWLQNNARRYRLRADSLRAFKSFNMDAAEFICGPLRQDLIEIIKAEEEKEKVEDKKCVTCHVIMNLPGSAIDYLPCFRGLLYQPGFSKLGAEDVRAVKVGQALGLGETWCGGEVRIVRNVAPGKEMVCISLLLPRELLLEQKSWVVENRKTPEKERTNIEGFGEAVMEKEEIDELKLATKEEVKREQTEGKGQSMNEPCSKRARLECEPLEGNGFDK